METIIHKNTSPDWRILCQMPPGYKNVDGELEITFPDKRKWTFNKGWYM